MSYKPIRVESEGDTVEQIFFECERRELREVVDDIVEIVQDIQGVENVKAIRREKANPVIKTGRNDRIYLRWDDGEARVNLGISHEPIPEVVSAYFINGNGKEAEDKFPWDREEMADYAKSLIDQKREATPGKEPQPEPTMGADERKRRAREEGNHRDERQQEPRGGKGRRGRDSVEFEDNKTVFLPPFKKQEAGYHGPASGPEPHLDCKDCVHYIEDGACHMVEGEIDPDGYCEDLFADVGIFGRTDEGEFIINLALWGEMFEDRFSRVSFETVASRVKEAIRKKL